MRDDQDVIVKPPHEAIARAYAEDCRELRPQGLAPLAVLLLLFALAVAGFFLL